MEILYLLIPLAVILAALIAWAFLWAIHSGQFDDLDGPAHRILMDDDASGIEGGEGAPQQGQRSRSQALESGEPDA